MRRLSASPLLSAPRVPAPPNRLHVNRPFPLNRPAITPRTRRRAIWIGLALLLLFWVWIAWPYLHATVVRDAAVTSWLNVSTAPISGDVSGALPAVGTRVGPDARLAEIKNPRSDRSALERALGNLAAAEARVVHLREAKQTRQALVTRYAAAFKQQLELRIAHDKSALDFLVARLTAERTDAKRFSTLRQAGSASLADAEAAASRLARLESERVALESSLAAAQLRRQSADQDVFLLENGSPSEWSTHLDLVLADRDLIAGESELAAARTVADAARRHFDQQQTATLAAAPGAFVWHRYVSPGASVQAGDPVVAWIDPEVLLVDVPLSDVEGALLVPGARADVVFEGERAVRRGVVVLTRGSGATLGLADLAAVTQARRPGTAQAIVQLEVTPADRKISPVGRAAYVDFPGVGVFTIIRARLRL